MRVCAACAQRPVSLTPAHVCLPAEVLERLRPPLQSPVAVAADVRRLPVGPGAFAADPAGLAVTRLGDSPLPTPLTTGGCRGGQAPGAHELAGVVDARPVARPGSRLSWRRQKALRRRLAA